MPFALGGLLVAALAGALAAALGFRWLARPLRRDPAAQAELAEAVAAVDRELAGNLELTTMFDQTRRAVVLENGAFARYRAILERELSAEFAAAYALYVRIAETESAMERRGPSNTLRDADRQLVEAWEGDARALQRALREALARPPLAGVAAATARLRARLRSG